MALEIFLRLDGVTGGSRNYYHGGWADVVSWQWNLSGAGAALPPDQLRVIKRVGMESPVIMGLWAQGGVVPAAEINIVPVVGKRDAQQKFISVKFQNLRVLAVEVGGNCEDNHATETLTLMFEQVRFEYHHYADATPDAPAGTVQTVAFDWRAVPA
jgi:type VI protein secretion system component Hcp